VVDLCEAVAPAASSGAGGSLAEQMSVQCTDGTAAEACIPECGADTHGWILLLNLDGTDTKFSCSLAHGLYSWMGAASEGGYLGADIQSFLSAVISGVAGTYMVTLTENADITTDLTIRPGQDVHISGDPALAAAPLWGSAGFLVQEGGSLALTHMTVEPSLIPWRCHGGLLSLSSMTVPTAMFDASDVQLSGVGSRLRLSAVTIVERPAAGELTGTMVVGVDGSQVVDPPSWGIANPRALEGTGWPCVLGSC
jgi:hypothetical protein